MTTYSGNTEGRRASVGQQSWTVQVSTQPDEQTATPLPNRKDRRRAARDAARMLNRARRAQ